VKSASTTRDGLRVNWTTPRELKGQLVRLWERGELLRPIADDTQSFPLRLSLKTPDSSDLTDRFEAVRSWAAELGRTPHLRLEWRELRHRVQGAQRMPAQAWVDTLDDAAALVGRRREVERFARLVASTREAMPSLVAWLARRPLQALELADRWPLLVAVVQWTIGHPRPGIYLRQVDVPGVHSKFLEMHRGVLAELLDLALPTDAIDASAIGASAFARRYGFLDKPQRIRFRVLDERIALLPLAARTPAAIGSPPDGSLQEVHLALPDMTLDASTFASLSLPVAHVFVTENETNFLAFPPAARSIAIFGAGYGWDALARAQWLAHLPIHYWGDIDTHGFAILDQLRRHFPHVSSLLMDRATLLAHETHWGEERDPVAHELSRLDRDERDLYDDLREHRIRSRLRLEQERIGFEWVRTAVAKRAMGTR